MPPFFYYLLTLATFGVIYGVLVIGLNIHWGYTGILDFMYIVFVAVGGYVTALLGLPPAQPALGETYLLGLNWLFLPALLGGGVAAMVLALVMGFLSLQRLRSDYFAIVTVAASLILWTIAGNATSLVNGWDGIAGVPQPLANALNLDLNSYSLFYLGLCSVFLLVVYLFAERLLHSPFGRALRSVREDEMVAQALGKDIFTLRLRSFMIGAFIAGIGGGLLVTYVDAFNPSAWASAETFFIWAALLLGGSANNRGAMLGALLVPVVFAEATRFLPNFYSPEFVNATRYIVIGILLILTVRFRPQGLLAERRFRIAQRNLLAPAEMTGPTGMQAADFEEPDGFTASGTEHTRSDGEEAHHGR
jgi:branched-chain amino acid transport system permease protein